MSVREVCLSEKIHPVRYGKNGVWHMGRMGVCEASACTFSSSGNAAISAAACAVVFCPQSISLALSSTAQRSSMSQRRITSSAIVTEFSSWIAASSAPDAANALRPAEVVQCASKAFMPLSRAAQVFAAAWSASEGSDGAVSSNRRSDAARSVHSRRSLASMVSLAPPFEVPALGEVAEGPAALPP